MLETGALLEREHFPLAERILRSFLAEHAPNPETCVVLNGLPRHVDQAKAVEPIVDVCTVISLRCTRQTVLARVFSNAGGDRAGRCDDDPELVLAKLESYYERTAPLVDYYRALDVPVRRIVVTAAMTADEIWRILERHGC
jgi:adenylate kinase family enzyme